VAYLKSLQ